MRTDLSQAAALHRRAATLAQAAATALESPQSAHINLREQHELAERLRAAAGELAPGWLGAPLDAQSVDTPLGGSALPRFVRIGTAQPLDDARFPALVPLLGQGHLTVDADARDARVAGLLRAVLLRLLATAPVGSLLVRTVDATASAIFAPFDTLSDAGLMAPVATDHVGLRAVLTEAEQWVRPARPALARHNRHDRTLLVVIAALPELTERADLLRITGLARVGPDAGLHLLLAGWPPPPLTAETTAPPLPRATMVSMRNPYALVGDPPGGSFGTNGPLAPSTGLNSPVFLDPDPPARLVQHVCQELAGQYMTGVTPALAELLPADLDVLRAGDPADGLTTTVGHAGDRPVTLRFNELTPHWLICGRSGAGKTAFLTNVLYGLCTRHHPDDLSVYLLSFADGAALDDLAPVGRKSSWLPQLRLVAVETDREYALAVLAELDAELARRARGDGASTARVLCVLDEFQVLFQRADRVAVEALARLESLARGGRPHGIHLLLAGQPVIEPAVDLTGLFGQFPVRIALPGGGQVLEPSNDAAAGLPLGVAVVNTAGGLGGPRRATRGHERVIRFPHPRADRAALRSWPARIRVAAGGQLPAARFFAGYAEHRLPDDPGYLAAVADRCRSAAPEDPARPAGSTPVALLGRRLDVELSPVAVPFDAAADRHLAVVGPGPEGAAVLIAAVRSLARQHPPGTVRFTICAAAGGRGAAPARPVIPAQPSGNRAGATGNSLVDPGEVADRLADELARRHRVERVHDRAGLTPDRLGPGYLLLFDGGGDGSGQQRPDPLSALLRDGTDHGVHLLGWWRAPDRYVAQLARQAETPIGTLVLVGASGVRSGLLGAGGYDGPLRPNRALLHDRRTGAAEVFIPFTPGREVP